MAITPCYFSSPFSYDSIFSIPTATPSQQDQEFVNGLFTNTKHSVREENLEQQVGISIPSIPTLQASVLTFTSNQLELPSTTLKTERTTRKRKSLSSTDPKHCIRKEDLEQQGVNSLPDIPTLQAPVLSFTSNQLELPSTTLKTQRTTRRKFQTHTCITCKELKTAKMWKSNGNTGWRCYTCYKKPLPSKPTSTHRCISCKELKTIKHWKSIGNTDWRCYTCYKKNLPSKSTSTHTCITCKQLKTIKQWKSIGSSEWRCFDCYKKTLPSSLPSTHTCVTCHETKKVRCWKRLSSTDWRCNACYKKKQMCDRKEKRHK